MTPRVSVILPVYNGEKYVAKAIESILAQETPAHEIIVVDDGSKDQTAEVLKCYTGRVTIHRIENAGASNARNVGMRLATGDVFAFLDHDDVWFRNYLRTHVDAMSCYPEAGLSCCNYVSRPVGMKGRMVPHFSTLRSLKGFQGPEMPDPFPFLFQECFIGTTSCVLVKKELVQKVGEFDRRYKICEDYDYWLRACKVTGFIVLGETLLYKKVHGSNISGNWLEVLLAHQEVQEAFFSANRGWIREKNLERLCRRELAEANYKIANALFDQGEPAGFFQSIFSAFRSDISPANAWAFSEQALKKTARLLTFDRIRRKRSS